MKVFHISFSDTKGGAARAAYRLHRGLCKAGVDSSMAVAEKYSDDEDVFVPVRDRIGYYERRLHYRQLVSRFWRYAPSRSEGLSPFTHPATPRNRHLVSKLPGADIINLHWIAHYVDLPTFLTEAQTPMVWTLHDMNAMTGGCHYALDCKRYKQRCGSCPQLGSDSDMDVSRDIWLRKRGLYRLVTKNRIHFVSPSHWLAEEAGQSSLLQEMQISVIPNGIDTRVFKPNNKLEARKELDIASDAKVILFTADSLVSQRKGLQFLLSALEGLSSRSKLFLVSLGGGEIKGDLPVPVLSLGHLQDERQISLVYSAADLFVLPSLQDNLPNTVLEALACGTPVIGFDVGGIPDMVRPGITGLLVPSGDIGELRRAILSLMEDISLRAQMGANCRQIAETEYALGVQAERYIGLYQKLLENRGLDSS